MTEKDDIFPDVRFDVDRPGLSLTITRLQDLHVGKSLDEFEQYEQSIFEEIKQNMTLDGAKDNPLFRSYRDLYWTFGMDPTKLRVSSEALLRRVLRGFNLWRVSNLVDVANLASAYHRIPIGLIDDSTRKGDLVVRAARKGELFERIGGKQITCRGREIVLADEEKIICFGYATHDSEKTKVTKGSTEVLLLLYGAQAASTKKMKEATEITIQMIEKWVDCAIPGWCEYRND
jgi:DNA/RNA-binding domain of Phe-tRNA-synthetase-like protein